MDAVRDALAYVNTPEGAIETITRVANTHRSDPVMADYDFFEEQIGLARRAVDYLLGEAMTLTPEVQEAIDYVRQIRT